VDKLTCVITGGNGGIGKATAIELAKNGSKIIILSRSSDKSLNAINEIITKSANEDIHHIPVDLAEVSSIKTACKELKRKCPKIDVLINNAGVIKRKYEQNSKGVEITFAVNYLAPFLINRILQENLKQSIRGRITNVTSALYKKGNLVELIPPTNYKFNGDKAYADSKLMNLIDTMYLSKSLSESNISVNCIHPGVVNTDAFREYPKWVSLLLGVFLTNPETAGKNLARIGASSDLAHISGKYFNVKKEVEIPTIGRLLAEYESIEANVRDFLEINS